MSKKVEMYQCEICGHTYTTEYYAEGCEFTHRKEEFANYMFQNGYNLRMVQMKTGVLFGLPEELFDVDVETKFDIRYLQSKNGYIYKIDHIADNSIEVVSAQDGYTSIVSFDDLCRGKEENK